MSDPTMPGQHPGAQPEPSADQMGAIEVKASFFVLAFMLFLFPAKASINGSAELGQGWGVRVYPVPAGRHQVRVWCPYFGMVKMGDAVHVVDVTPGQVTAVEWKCPWFMFMPGKWVPLGVRPLTAQDLQGGAPAPTPVAPGPMGQQSPGQQFPAQHVPTQPAGAQAPVATPAGWHPDPQGQAALRYWDGQQWTEHTNDGQGATG